MTFPPHILLWCSSWSGAKQDAGVEGTGSNSIQRCSSYPSAGENNTAQRSFCTAFLPVTLLYLFKYGKMLDWGEGVFWLFLFIFVLCSTGTTTQPSISYRKQISGGSQQSPRSLGTMLKVNERCRRGNQIRLVGGKNSSSATRWKKMTRFSC